MNKSRSSWLPIVDMPPTASKKPFRKQRLCDFCQPRYPRDPKIMGLLRERGGELVVHKESCPHLIDNAGQISVLVPTRWQLQYPSYRATFFLSARDRNGLAFDIDHQLATHSFNFSWLQGELERETYQAEIRC